MKAILFLFSLLLLLTTVNLTSQELNTPEGVKMIENKTFDNSDEARQEILELYRDLRVTDILDGDPIPYVSLAELELITTNNKNL